MSEEEVIKKLESIRVCGCKGELWNFEAATILNILSSQRTAIEELNKCVDGYCDLAKQIKEDYEQRLEEYYNEG